MGGQAEASSGYCGLRDDVLFGTLTAVSLLVFVLLNSLLFVRMLLDEIVILIFSIFVSLDFWLFHLVGILCSLLLLAVQQ